MYKVKPVSKDTGFYYKLQLDIINIPIYNLKAEIAERRFYMKTNFEMTFRIKQYLQDAAERSNEVRGIRVVTSDYLLLCVIEDETNELAKYLFRKGIFPEDFENDLFLGHAINQEVLDNFYQVNLKETIYSEEVKEILEDAWELSIKKGRKKICMNAFLVALVQNDNLIWEIMSEYDEIDIEELMDQFSKENFLKGKMQKTEPIETFDLEKEGIVGLRQRENPKKSIPDMFRLLNQEFSKDQPITILGRDEEIEKALIIFQKMTTKNIILVGKPGVGKTAIVEGIVERIVKGTVPKEFKNKRVMALDINAFLERTSYLGQFQEKCKIFQRFLEENEDVILFIDEIHNIIGAGRTKDSAYDFANALKPILANGKVRVIGATTQEEYQKYFSKDGALKRRFEVIEVKEPRSNELYPMLKGKIARLESYHGVSVKENVFETVVAEASAYEFTKANPARTVDLLDMAMVIAKNHQKDELDIRSILEVHKTNIKRFKKMSKEVLEATAYHEAGHYILHETLNRKFSEVTLVSIIPAQDSLGINVFERKEDVGPRNSDELIHYIAEYLAGDLASNLKGYPEDSGKRSDLENATNCARNMVLRYGMMEKQGILGSYSSYTGGGHNPLEFLSDNQKEELTLQVEKILEKAYKLAKSLLNEKDNELEIIAKALLERGSLNRYELEGLYTGELTLEDLPEANLNLIK